MASSGIAEHMEAQKRQQWMNRKAAWILEKLETEELQQKVDDYHQQQTEKLTTYQKQLSGRSQPDGNSTDRQRRDATRRDQMVEYSAKIPNRYNSINYSQQW